MRCNPIILFPRIRQPVSEQGMTQFAEIERYQRIKVTLPRHHFVGNNGKEKEHDSCNISPKLKNRSQNQIDNSEEFDGISKLITRMRVICNSNKSHIQHYFGVEPATLDGELA